MKYNKDDALNTLWQIVLDEEEDLKARRSALTTLYKYDEKEKVIQTIEKLYEESTGITKVQMAQLIIKLSELEKNTDRFLELEL